METLTAALSSVQTVATRNRVAISGVAVLLVVHRLWRLSQRRSRDLPHSQERVLVVGASSGIGRATAHEYATAGARVCVVGRREHELDAVVKECESLLPVPAGENSGDRVLRAVGDFTKPEDMLAIREKLDKSMSHGSASLGNSGLNIIIVAVRMGRPGHPHCLCRSLSSAPVARGGRAAEGRPRIRPSSG